MLNFSYDNYSSGYSSPIPVQMKSRIYIEVSIKIRSCSLVYFMIFI